MGQCSTGSHRLCNVVRTLHRTCDGVCVACFPIGPLFLTRGGGVSSMALDERKRWVL